MLDSDANYLKGYLNKGGRAKVLQEYHSRRFQVRLILFYSDLKGLLNLVLAIAN